MLPLKRGASKRNVYAAVMQHDPGCEIAARSALYSYTPPQEFSCVSRFPGLASS